MAIELGLRGSLKCADHCSLVHMVVTNHSRPDMMAKLGLTIALSTLVEGPEDSVRPGLNIIGMVVGA